MIVIKLGGAAGMDVQPLLQELARMEEPWVLVHGGNQELTQLQDRLGTPARFADSPGGNVSRLTDADTIAAMQMAYRGRINNDLVLQLQNLGCNAVGLSGIDGGLLRAQRKDAFRILVDGKKQIHRGDLSGRITEVNPAVLHALLDAGMRPVVTMPVWSTDGHAVNADGDRAAAAIANALGARQLVILSRVRGLLQDPEDDASLIHQLSREDLGLDQWAQGRFRMKLVAAEEALAGSVEQVVLGTSNRENPVSNALAGDATVIA